MDNRALDDALEGGGGPGILAVGHDEAVELLVDEILEVALERFYVDVATGEYRDGIAVIGQRQQQVLQGGKLVSALTSQVHCLMQGLLKSARKRWHMTGSYCFSITHCSGCWFLRAASMTRVTLVSATSNG